MGRNREIIQHPGKRISALLFAVGFILGGAGHAQTSENLPDYVPLVPQVQAKAPVIDPQKGYSVQQLKADFHMITEGAYDCAFVTTGKGDVLFDAPSGTHFSNVAT